MRNAFILSLVLVTLPVAAQEWSLERFPSSAALAAATEERLDEGLTPVSVDTGPELGLAMLYARVPGWEASAYRLEEIDALEELTPTVTARIREGWFPMDISFREGTYALLFTDSRDVIDGWRLVVVNPSFATLQRTLGEYREDGFTPVGISATDDDQLAVLLLRLPERGAGVPLVAGVDPNPEETVSFVQSMIGDGWRPMSVTSNPEELVMLFVRFD